jgi:hypothetical protein
MTHPHGLNERTIADLVQRVDRIRYFEITGPAEDAIIGVLGDLLRALAAEVTRTQPPRGETP